MEKPNHIERNRRLHIKIGRKRQYCKVMLVYCVLGREHQTSLLEEKWIVPNPKIFHWSKKGSNLLGINKALEI